SLRPAECRVAPQAASVGRGNGGPTGSLPAIYQQSAESPTRGIRTGSGTVRWDGEALVVRPPGDPTPQYRVFGPRRLVCSSCGYTRDHPGLRVVFSPGSRSPSLTRSSVRRSGCNYPRVTACCG